MHFIQSAWPSQLNQTTERSTKVKNQTEAIRDFFNDSEWLAIERALGDYQDYGEEEAKIADSIEAKIYKLFKSDSLKVTDL